MSSSIIAGDGVLDLVRSISAHHFEKRLLARAVLVLLYKVCLRSVVLLKIDSSSWSQDACWLMPLSDSHLSLFPVVTALYSSTHTWLSLIVLLFLSPQIEWLSCPLGLGVVKSIWKLLLQPSVSKCTVSWVSLSFFLTNKCIACWFPRNFLGSVKLCYLSWGSHSLLVVLWGQ